MKPQISLIVAIDQKNGISKNGIIPWSIKEDAQFFMDVTKRQKNAVLVMGRKTWLSCKDQIKDRKMLVVSSTLKTNSVPTLNDAVDWSIENKIEEIFVCGGREIYHEALNSDIVDFVYLTTINHDYECDNVVVMDLKLFTCYKKNTFEVYDLKNELPVKVTFSKYYRHYHPINVNPGEDQYLSLLNTILNDGHFRLTRNSRTWSMFNKSMTFNLQDGFPLLTTKKMFLKGIFLELMFFLSGSTDAKKLSKQGVHIWDANTSREFLDAHGLSHYEVGDMGPLYSHVWNHQGYPYQGCDKNYEGCGFNQIKYVMDLLRNDPYSRRIIMTSYDPGVAQQGCLYPCHSIVIQFYVDGDNKLNAVTYNRSQDIICGVNFNTCMLSLLVHMFCEILNFKPGEITIHMGDVHIYEDHKSSCIRQILRDPYPLPKLKFKRKVAELLDFKFEDLELLDYQSYPIIKSKMIA